MGTHGLTVGGGTAEVAVCGAFFLVALKGAFQFFVAVFGVAQPASALFAGGCGVAGGGWAGSAFVGAVFDEECGHVYDGLGELFVVFIGVDMLAHDVDDFVAGEAGGMGTAHNFPFVDSTPWMRGFWCIAALRARPTALKMASSM